MSAQAVEAAVRARRASQWVGGVLWVVTGGAMVTAAATVTAWAIEHGMSPWVAWLVDPLLSVALLTALIGEGVLSRHGWRGGAWPAVLRWGTGGLTLTCNVWSSVADRDPAGVVLHAIAPALVVTVAEAAPRLRRRLAELADHLEAEAARVEVGSIESTPTGSTRAPIDVVSTVVTDPIEVGVIEPTGSTPTPTGSGLIESAPISRAVEPIGSARIDPAPIESARSRSSAPAPRAVGVERAGARSIEACRVELAAAIESGELPPTPSAEAIRRVLSVGPARARALRDELAAAAVAPMPGQTAIDDDQAEEAAA